MRQDVNRIYFLDSMRSILMILGVFLHSAQVFRPRQTWYIYSENTTILSDYIIHIISTFRMPAFFVVSGYFCALTLMKYSPSIFLKVRLVRIAVPFFCTAITLNTLQEVVLVKTGWEVFDFNIYLLGAEWVGHLWFLTNLMIYFFCSAMFVIFFKRVIPILKNNFEIVFSKVPFFLILLIMPIATIAILALNKIGFPLYSDFFIIFDTSTLFRYLPYFIFGCLLLSGKDAIYKFSKLSPFLSILMIICITYLMKNFLIESTSGIQLVLLNYVESLEVWFSIALCFSIFHTFFNQPKGMWAFLSDASYTVYLFHHSLVIIIGMVLIKLQILAIPGLIVLIMSVLLITLGIHKKIILNSSILRFLFNGK